jgi:hypothetical protein
MISQDGVLTQGFVMKIWNEDCLDYNLGVDTATTIRDIYEVNKTLNLTIATKTPATEHNIFRRCLANQAVWSHYKWNSTFPDNIWNAGDWESISDSNRRNLASNEYCCETMGLLKEIAHEIDVETEDD